MEILRSLKIGVIIAATSFGVSSMIVEFEGGVPPALGYEIKHKNCPTLEIGHSGVIEPNNLRDSMLNVRDGACGLMDRIEATERNLDGAPNVIVDASLAVLGGLVIGGGVGMASRRSRKYRI